VGERGERQERKIMHISWPYISAHSPGITHQMFTTVKNVMNRSCREGQNKRFTSNTYSNKFYGFEVTEGNVWCEYIS